MKIVTWNLRCVWKDTDGVNSFIHRAGVIYDKIMREMPDVISLQEVVPNSLELMKRMLPEYEFFGSMRDTEFKNEGLYTAFRKDKFALISADVFWMSPTPYAVGSRFEDQSPCPRPCVCVKLRDIHTQAFYRVVNVHLDHVSDYARQQGLQCLFEYIQERESMEKLPTFILGDFNACPESETIAMLQSQKWLVEATEMIHEPTFHGFYKTTDCKKIDYIFVTTDLKDRIKDVSLWKDEANGVYLSDHYPVCVNID